MRISQEHLLIVGLSVVLLLPSQYSGSYDNIAIHQYYRKSTEN